MTRIVVAVLLAAALPPMLAAPVEYNAGFTSSGMGGATPFGSFTYDPSAGFSNFVVHWGSADLDLTSSANVPLLASDPATGCDSAAPGHEYGFLLMTQSVTGCAAGYAWSGLYFGAIDSSNGYAQLFFILVAGSAQDEIAASALFPADPSPVLDMASGTWSVTEESSDIPEPHSLCLALLGALALGACASRRPAQK